MRPPLAFIALTAAALALSLAVWRRPAQASRQLVASAAPNAARLPDLGPMPELSGGTRWINSQPISRADLAGKVTKKVVYGTAEGTRMEVELP